MGKNHSVFIAIWLLFLLVAAADYSDRWVFPVFLKPGKYTYKFIVDGRWVLDPANRLYEENQYGTGNSVLRVEQSGK